MQNGVSLVCMAPGAGDRHSHHVSGDHVNDRIQIIELRQLDVGRLVIPDSESIKTGGDQRFQIPVFDFVASQLVDEEVIDRLVLVDRIDYPVAISPCRWFGSVPFVSVGVGISNRIEPVAGPLHTVLWRGEVSINHLLVGVR